MRVTRKGRSQGWAAPALLAGCLALAPAAAAERRAEASLQFVLYDYAEFDESDPGGGVQLSYRLNDWLAADGSLAFFPGDLGAPAFSGSRTEGLFGLRVGPRLGRNRLFASLRAGFLSFGEAPEPIACIAIFPPPLGCTLAAGESVFALQYGAGFEAPLGEKAMLRVEVGDALLKYPGPALAKDGAVLDDHFWGHNLRVAAGLGLRF